MAMSFGASRPQNREIPCFTIFPWSHSMTILEHIYSISKNYPRNPKQCGGVKRSCIIMLLMMMLMLIHAIHAYTIRRIPLFVCTVPSCLIPFPHVPLKLVPSTRVSHHGLKRLVSIFMSVWRLLMPSKVLSLRWKSVMFSSQPSWMSGAGLWKLDGKWMGWCPEDFYHVCVVNQQKKTTYTFKKLYIYIYNMYIKRCGEPNNICPISETINSPSPKTQLTI